MAILQAVLDQLDKARVFAPLEEPSGSLVIAESAFAPAITALARKAAGTSKVVVIVPTESEASALAGELMAFDALVGSALIPSWDTFAFERVSPRAEAMGSRIRWLRELALRDLPESNTKIFILSARSAAQRFAMRWLTYQPVRIALGERIDSESVIRRLSEFGYRHEYQVESIGEFAIRGSILDVFPADRSSPVRVDLFGDEVDRLTEFSLADQRSTSPLSEVLIHPAREFRPDSLDIAYAERLARELPELEAVFARIQSGEYFDGMESWAPFFPEFSLSPLSLMGEGDVLVISEYQRISERVAALIEEEQELLATLGATWGLEPSQAEEVSLYVASDALLGETSARVLFRQAIASGVGEPRLDIERAALSDRREESIVATLRRDVRSGLATLVSADSASMANRIIASLKEAGVAATALRDQGELVAFFAKSPASRGIGCFISSLEAGFISASGKMSIYGPYDLTGRRAKRKMATSEARAAAALFEALAPGGYVVHDFHGIGRYLGMVRREVASVERDYLEIEYRDKAKLFIPTDQMGVITPYSGGEKPALSRLGGHEWQKTKAKVKKSVERIAQELVLLYQKRLHSQGIAHLPDTVWQAEMEDLFPYTLTRDQRKAITEVKADMESDRPMDRLVCGDVGFGKTEVAIRAAFKAVQSGYQVAILVPTTLLAHQHHQTFAERFAQFPLRVEVVSRFLSSSEVKEVLAGVADGTVDVVIGTHRLLSRDVKFSKLGLLVVDEEQRFGVNHKEAVKRLAVNVDILTLTATPIPRTLEMSLTGLRDLSLLSTPPGSRQPILTFVGGYDEAAVVEAIRRELLREGQVFFVHNRVKDIETVASKVRSLVSDARVAVAHGQMDESELERIVDAFWQGNFDVLVCTTIIESGIDMPTVNTMVVDRAEMLGLGQLHQLRGRVGRGATKAYAYLFHAPDTKLTEEAYERLKTIGEAVELGAGFRIAMRDLEIRGAGNLLGENQSGHISAIGYDLYVKMVKEAIAYLNGEEIKAPSEIRIDIAQTATIATSYISKDDLRLEAYKSLADCVTDAEVSQLMQGWADRFGPVPPETQVLGEVTKIRNRAGALAASEVRVERLASPRLNRYRLRLVGVSPPQSVLVNFQRRFQRVNFHEHSKTLTIEATHEAGGPALALEVLDLVISRQNLKSAQVG